jgi:hypothetical protein
MARLAFLLLIVLIAACSPTYSNPKEGTPVAADEVRLSWKGVDPARAESDASAALAKGDRHLLGTYGYAAGTPGYPSGPEQWPHGVIYVEDTTDYARDRRHGEYVQRANSYAEAYNRVIVASSPTPPRTSVRPRWPG